MSRISELRRIALLTYRLDLTTDEQERRPLIAERNEIEKRIGGYANRDDAQVHTLLTGMKERARERRACA